MTQRDYSLETSKPFEIIV